MNQLTEFLVNSILAEGDNEIIGIYGGGFKPPIKGHVAVVENIAASDVAVASSTVSTTANNNKLDIFKPVIKITSQQCLLETTTYE